MSSRPDPNLRPHRDTRRRDGRLRGAGRDGEGCPECAPVYPTDEVQAFCADDGHCDIRYLAGG